MRLGKKKAMVESDPLEVLNLIWGKTSKLGEALNWIEDIRILSRYLFTTCSENLMVLLTTYLARGDLNLDSKRIFVLIEIFFEKR